MESINLNMEAAKVRGKVGKLLNCKKIESLFKVGTLRNGKILPKVNIGLLIA
jgi:hypothetical protein